MVKAGHFRDPGCVIMKHISIHMVGMGAGEDGMEKEIKGLKSCEGTYDNEAYPQLCLRCLCIIIDDVYLSNNKWQIIL